MINGVGVTRDSCNVDADEDVEEAMMSWAIFIGDTMNSIFYNRYVKI